MTEKWSTAGGSKPLSYADLLRKAKEAKSGGDEQQQSAAAGTTSSSTSASASATALSPPPNARPPTFSSPSFPRPGMPLSPSSKPADTSTAGTPRTILSSPAGKAPAPRQHSQDASPLRAPQPNGIVKDHPTSSPSASGPQASASHPLSGDNKSPTKSTPPTPNIWEVRRQQRAAAQAQSQQTATPVRPPARAATEPSAVVASMVTPPARPQDSSSMAASAKPAEETATKQAEATKQPASAPAPSSSMIKDSSTSTSTPPKGPKSTTTTFDGNVWQRPSSSAGTPATPTAQSKTPAIREGEDDNAWLSRVAMMNEGHHMLKKDRGASADGSGDDAKTPRKTAWGRFGALASPTPSPQPPAAASSSAAAAANPPPQTPPPASASNAGKAAQKADKDTTPSASSTRPSSSTAPSKSDWPSLDEAERDRERPSTSSTSHGAAPPSFHPPGSTGSSTPVSVGGGSAGSASGAGSNLDAIKGVVQIKNPAGQRKGGKNWVEIVPEITHSGPTPSRRNVLRGWAGKLGQQEKEKGGASSSTSRSRESTERAGAGQSGAATSSTIQILGSGGKGTEQKAHASSEGNKAAEEPRSSDTWDDEPPAPPAPTSRRGLHSPRSRQYKTPYPRRFGPPNAEAEPETSTAAATSDKAPTVQPAHPTPSSMRLNSDGSFSPARHTSARAQPYSRSKQEWEARSGMGRGRSASSFSEHDGGSSGAGGGPSRRYPGHGHGESMSSSINDVPHGNHRHSHAPQGSMDQSGTYWDPSMAPMPPHHFVAGHESFSSPHEIPYGHPMLFDGTRFWPAFPVPHHPDFGAPYHHGHPIPSPQHHSSQPQHWHGPPLESAPAGDPQHAQRQAAPPTSAPSTAPDGPSGQPASEPPLQTPELPSGVAQLVGQVEWYCSSQNLAGDNFLRSQMDPASGWIPLSLISSFRRLRSMCEEVGLTLDHPDVQAALAASHYVELDDEGKRIRKRNDWAEWVLQPPRTPAMSNHGIASYVQPGAVPSGHHSSAPPVPTMSSSYDGPVVGSPRPLAPHAYYGQPGEDQAYPPPPPPPAQAHPPPGMNFYPPTQPQPQHFYHAPQHPFYQSAPPNLTPTGPAAYSAIPPYAPAAMGAPQHPHHHHHHHHGIDHLTTTPRDVPTWRGAPAPMHWSRQDGLYSPVEAGHAAAAANAASAAQYGSAAHQPQTQHHSVGPRAPRQSLPTSASLPPHPDHHLHQQQQQRGVLPVDLPGSRRNVAAAAASSSQDEPRLPPPLQSPTHHQIQPHAQPQPQPTFVRHASQQTDITTTSASSSSGLDATPSAISGGGSGSGSGAANTATTAPTTTRTNSSVSVSLSLGAHSPSSPTSPASNRSGGGGGGGVMIGEDGPTSSPSPTRRTKPPGLGHAQGQGHGQGQMSPTTLSRQHQKLATIDASQNHKKGNDASAAAALSTGGARTSAHAASHHIRQREGSGDGGSGGGAGGGAAGGGAGGGDDSEDDCLGIVAAEGLGGLVEAKAKRTAAA